jgi:hypothetical protein
MRVLRLYTFHTAPGKLRIQSAHLTPLTETVSYCLILFALQMRLGDYECKTTMH